MDINCPSNRPEAVPLRRALSYWLKLGFISFGGPAGQIAIMHHDLVEKKRWISEQRFLHALNYCMLLPGPEAQQLATYIGWLMHRSWGGLIAGGFFVLPSFFILVSLAWVYMRFGTVPAIAGTLYGIKPAVVAIVLFAAYRIGTRALKNNTLWAIAALAFLALFAFNLPFPLIILTAGGIGVLGGRYAPDRFKVGDGHKAVRHETSPALIDDDTPTPPHALFSWKRFMGVLLASVVLWIVAISVLLIQFGWHGTYTQMGWFFTKAALLTFGGAYAVLPYLYQNAVVQFHWLTPTQMMDALALGETTPGQLIMVVTFVGFLGGWTKQVLGPGAFFASAFAAAAIVTFFTFLPSFAFILLGGPFIETTHGNLKFTAPLTAITSAVVGVILNLAAFFAWHVFWPGGWNTPTDWVSIALTITALLALFRFKTGVIPLILACGVFGLTWKVFM